MKYRFIEKLNEFLNSMGRSDLINPQLDCHSNIQLEMNDSPSINIDLSTDELILWCNLAECNYSRLDSISASLLRNLMEYAPRNFQQGQPALNLIEDTLVLSAILREASMDNMQLFADSFDEFFERANELRTQLV